MIKFTKLRDNNEYLLEVIEFINGYWTINTDNINEIVRLLNKNRIRYDIKYK